ncbi:MAG: lysine--tRNA ligase [Candidatus Yonathbacteria bacterium]|nr:lysine--tRNA ligase [Candidatus Yonathbacteria bacterium]
MASIEEIRAERLKKLKDLTDAGVSTYPATSARTHYLKEVMNDFETLQSEAGELVVVGRILASRGQGALIFADLFDGTAKMQVVIKLPETPESVRDFYVRFVDIGDFIEVKGNAFATKTGQQSIFAREVKMLAKSLLPLPDKFHGIQDEELRLRLRYLDIITNPELRSMFERKAKFWQVVRKFLSERGFLEVETPTLETTTGGAEAQPFATHHNDYDLDMFMRISVGELWQKRLMSAGFPKTFEIGRVYRNEGTSPEHTQEFTNCEFYFAYANYEEGMKIVQELYRTIAREVFNTTTFTTRGHTFDLADEWQKIDYREEVLRQTGIDIELVSDADIKNKLAELKVKYEGHNRERLIDTLWKYCRKNISGPVFLVNSPLLVSPLAKKNEDGKTVQQFQPILAGSEVGKGYSELNDPLDQRRRFEIQQQLLASGDKEAMMADWDFIEMLEHGMPPTCGFGFGERLFAFLSDKPLRETQMFPLVRPKARE